MPCNDDALNDYNIRQGRSRWGITKQASLDALLQADQVLLMHP